jgi:hypothetical protein
MSLGNVSYSRMNEEYFRQAIYCLRTASDIAGFPLPSHLQRYVPKAKRYHGLKQRHDRISLYFVEAMAKAP